MVVGRARRARRPALSARRWKFPSTRGALGERAPPPYCNDENCWPRP